jgi:hypothetical protein
MFWVCAVCVGDFRVAVMVCCGLSARFTPTRFQKWKLGALFVGALCQSSVLRSWPRRLWCDAGIADKFIYLAVRQSNSLFSSRDFKMATPTSRVLNWWEGCDGHSSLLRRAEHTTTLVAQQARRYENVSPTQNAQTQNHGPNSRRVFK